MKRSEERKGEAQLRERAGVAGFGDANEGAAETENVGDRGDHDGRGCREESGCGHVSDGRFVAAAPDGAGDAEKRKGRNLNDRLDGGEFGSFEETGNGENGYEQEKKGDAEEKAN